MITTGTLSRASMVFLSVWTKSIFDLIVPEENKYIVTKWNSVLKQLVLL